MERLEDEVERLEDEMSVLAVRAAQLEDPPFAFVCGYQGTFVQENTNIFYSKLLYNRQEKLMTYIIVTFPMNMKVWRLQPKHQRKQQWVPSHQDWHLQLPLPGHMASHLEYDECPLLPRF